MALVLGVGHDAADHMGHAVSHGNERDSVAWHSPLVAWYGLLDGDIHVLAGCGQGRGGGVCEGHERRIEVLPARRTGRDPQALPFVYFSAGGASYASDQILHPGRRHAQH